METTDFEIRRALHRKVLRYHHENKSTIIVDELGLAHGRSRIDVAVLNGHLHGYEIKSSRDTLIRLPSQIELYRKSLQKLTIVSAWNHLDNVLSMAPEWCGVIEVRKGPRGGISFFTIRRAAINPEVDPMALAHLLWRKEAIELLAKTGLSDKELNKSRKQLYEIIADKISFVDLTCWIKKKFTERSDWRLTP